MIKILFLAANPKDTDRIRLDEEVAPSENACGWRPTAASSRSSRSGPSAWATSRGTCYAISPRSSTSAGMAVAPGRSCWRTRRATARPCPRPP